MKYVLDLVFVTGNLSFAFISAFVIVLTACVSCIVYLSTSKVYVCMYLRAGVQPTLDPYAEAFIAGPLH